MGARKAKSAKQLSNAEIDRKICRIVEIRPVANEYRELCREVKEALIERPEFVTTAGHTAVVKRKPVYVWVVELLENVLPKKVFETLCPRVADKRKLDQRLAALPEDKAFAACRVEMKDKLGKPQLEVTAFGESTPTADEDVEEEAA